MDGVGIITSVNMAGGRRRRARQRRRHQRRRHQDLVRGRDIPDRSNPLEDLSEEGIFSRFRFRADTILFILGTLRLERQTRRSNPLPPLLQLLATLRFLATGGFCSLVADTFEYLSSVSVYRCLTVVCKQLAEMARHYVYMPTGLQADDTKKLFYKIAGKLNLKHHLKAK